jgi:hypothetical protein
MVCYFFTGNGHIEAEVNTLKTGLLTISPGEVTILPGTATLKTGTVTWKTAPIGLGKIFGKDSAVILFEPELSDSCG